MTLSEAYQDVIMEHEVNLRAARATAEMLVENFFSSASFGKSEEHEIGRCYESISVMLMQIENTLFDFLKEYDLVGSMDENAARKCSGVDRFIEISKAR